MKRYSAGLIAGSLVALLAFVLVSTGISSKPVEASVSQGSSYNSIVTASAQASASFLQNTTIATGTPGTLGSVIITGAGTGSFTLYDATTSNALLRTLTATTSLRVLAQFTNNAATGTYTFDEQYYQGLLVEFIGAQGTTTITYRPF